MSTAATSRAAHAVIKPKKATLKELVTKYALNKGVNGFTDNELIDDYTKYIGEEDNASYTAGWRSIQPRRTELTYDGILIDTGTTRKNAKGHDTVVWAHYSFYATAPIPIPRLSMKELQRRNAELEAQVKALTGKLAAAGIPV
jgi:hypothetical protein